MWDELCLEQQNEKDLLTSDETYACSQGMFGGDDDNPKPLEMGGYIMNEEEKSEESFYEPEADKEYIFIRLINTKYKKLCATDILGKGINLVDTPLKKTRMIYNHATISTMLTDNFYGFTLDKDKPYTLKFESILRPEKNKLLNSGRPNESKFVVYAIKVNKSEYANIQKYLNDSLKDSKLTYDVFKLPFIGMNAFKNKVKSELIDKVFSKSTEAEKIEAGNSITEDYENAFVCSTFVSYVIWKFTSIGKTMDKNNLKYGSFTPDDLANRLPDVHYLFSGTWNEYNYKALNFISKHEGFNKYFKNGGNK